MNDPGITDNIFMPDLLQNCYFQLEIFQLTLHGSKKDWFVTFIFQEFYSFRIVLANKTAIVVEKIVFVWTFRPSTDASVNATVPTHSKLSFANVA